jgi:K+-sensing histidine kinase KdpD
MNEGKSLDRPRHEAVDVVFELLNTTPVRRSFNSRYGVAITTVVIAFCMRYVFSDDLLHRLPFVFFIPATLITAWYGGFGAGIAAGVLGLLLGDYFFLEPYLSWGPPTALGRMAIIMYAFTCLVGIIAIELLHISIWKLRTENERLRQQIKARGSDTAQTPSPLQID